MLPEEIKSYLLSNKKPNHTLIQKRTKLCMVYWKGDDVKIMESAEAQKFFDSELEPKRENNSVLSEEIRNDKLKMDGVIASPGKAIGRAKVVLNAREINKVHRGDILIATMTSPDYVVGMKKAAAIITDEGGITCHAAIVSRELGIPCIVGTKIATKYLKDGEVIEVNANHGSVRIVKK
jgi:phosphoenolpyruvate synthase/pyruvate phosphate dikinase